MSIAIHYTSIKPPTTGTREIFGLQIAISDWLRAYFRHARVEKFAFLIGEKNERDEILEIAKQVGVDARRVDILDRRFPEQNFSQFSTIFRPEPDTRHLLWQRQQGYTFSFCGLAHAISGKEAGDVLQDYCLSPSEVTDAIVCPSHAVKMAIRAFWSNYGDYMNQRFGAAYTCPVELPVIPLGVDVEKLEAKISSDKRAEQRKKLGIGADDIVLLWTGRLSAAIKAHPLSMFQAAEMAAERTGTKVHLVMMGYFVPEDADTQFSKLAHDICSKAAVIFIASNDKRFPDGLWAAGDIFLSLVDNCQESFGLTPIEVIAAGLPRIISDWDGYRDSVEDGEDGFLIRTTMPPPGQGFELTTQVLNGREVYGGFLAKTALTTVVDINQAADRIEQLIVDKNLRQSMAEKAKAKLHTTYSWEKIIRAYEDLWADLAARRAASPPVVPRWASAIPTVADPYTMYESYPTSSLKMDDVVSLVATPQKIEILWRHGMNTYAHDTLLSAPEITTLLRQLSETGSLPISSFFANFPVADKARIWRTIAWLLKLNIMQNHLAL